MYRLKDIFDGIVELPSWAAHGIICTEVHADIASMFNQLQGKLPCYSFTLVESGWTTLRYNGNDITITQGDLFTHTPGVSITMVATSDDYHAFALLAEEDLTLGTPIIRRMVRAAYFPFVELQEPKLLVNKDDMPRLCHRMQDIISYQHMDHLYKEDMLQILYSAFLLDLLNIQERSVNQHKLSERSEELFITFVHMLPNNFLEHRDIAYYADKLCITSAYLSRIVKQITGHTVGDYINQLLLMEASWMLQNTHMTTTQIAERLHFSSQASFCRFFTRLKGMSPKVFRWHR